MSDYPFLREVNSPITPNQLRPLDARCERVQFSEPLSERDHKKLARFLRKYPDVELRAYGHYFKKFNLNFLRHYPAVRHLSIEVFELRNLDGLQLVSPELKSFGLGQTRSRAHSLSFLQRFPQLRSLYLEGHQKDIHTIGTLSQLETLILRSITLPDLSILRPLSRLRSLGIKLGGTKNLDLLSKIGELRYLELWMIRGLTDLGPIASVRTLQYLFLQALKNVEGIPSLARLPLLRRVDLVTMKGLRNLRSVAKAPALEDLLAIDMSQLQPEDFRPFVGHPNLRRATVGLGSLQKNKAVMDLLPLPHANREFKFKNGTGFKK